ncbi:MAG: hypothetical protein M0030_11450 [Actinomycetota bacterium]|nr:hypothetical protein [Actinomycetota bacterium]
MTHATTEQPGPSPASGDVWLSVIQDMNDRRLLGIARYGTPLQAGNGRDALVDAYQEALDLAVYLKQRLTEQAGQVLVSCEDAAYLLGELALLDPARHGIRERVGWAWPAGVPRPAGLPDGAEIPAATDGALRGTRGQLHPGFAAGTWQARPVTVEAIQICPGNGQEIAAFLGDTPHEWDMSRLSQSGSGWVARGLWLWVAKASARLYLPAGDWIIRELDGVGFYPCTADAFAARYSKPQDNGQ